MLHINYTDLLKIAIIGIPDKGTSTMPTHFDKPRVFDISIQEHDAKKAGKHYDIRLSDGNVAYSWAVRRIPNLNESIGAFKQPDHSPSYMNFSGTIPEGYGAGKVKVVYKGKAEVLSWDSKRLRFNIYDGPFKGEYSLFAAKNPKYWKLMNHTLNKTKHPEIPNSKPKYKEITPRDKDKLEELLSDPNWVASEKIDGAHVTISVLPGANRLRIASYRPTERKTGIIDHTWKFEKLLDYKPPKELQGTILRAEAFAMKDGKPVSARTLGGILNSNTWKARKEQKDKPLILALLDVVKYKGKDMEDAPYEEKLKILRKILTKLPKGSAIIPVSAYTKDEKIQLLQAIKKLNKNVHTKEGVVFWNRKEGKPPIKMKYRPDYDIYVRGFFEGTGRLKNKGVGGFYYSWSPEGPIVGRVGTGLSDRLRQDMLRHPEKYIGRVALVRALERYQAKHNKNEPGALRAPSFAGWHLDKNMTGG